MTTQAPQQEDAQDHDLQPPATSVAELLVWRSPRSGAFLSRGRPLTQQQAIHACLTHSRNEIDQSQTTPTRLVYRTLGGSVCVYEGTRPGLAQPRSHQAHVITSLPEPPACPTAATTPARGPQLVQVSVRRFAGLLGIDTVVAGDMLTELQTRRRDRGLYGWPDITILHDPAGLSSVLDTVGWERLQHCSAAQPGAGRTARPLTGHEGQADD